MIDTWLPKAFDELELARSKDVRMVAQSILMMAMLLAFLCHFAACLGIDAAAGCKQTLGNVPKNIINRNNNFLNKKLI